MQIPKRAWMASLSFWLWDFINLTYPGECIRPTMIYTPSGRWLHRSPSRETWTMCRRKVWNSPMRRHSGSRVSTSTRLYSMRAKKLSTLGPTSLRFSHSDAMVGQVLAALQDNGYAANTDVILWSDHGYHLGEKFHWRKMTFWEQATRVPLLISSPGNPNYPPVDVFEEVSLLDIAATVLDLAGIAPESQFEGAPLHDTVNRSPVEIYIDDGVATVENGVKNINYDVNVPGLADVALYDLTIDPRRGNPFVAARLLNSKSLSGPGHLSECCVAVNRHGMVPNLSPFERGFRGRLRR
ncbi:MAG: sulfatase-like hydrolase/transferase [Halioglobus sp.]|nr:sulfatase-like hydrolase/transferase [Halioglobus sp.]